MQRKEKILEIIKNLDDNTRDLLLPLVDQLVDLEIRLTELSKEPFISFHPNNRAVQKKTTAAILYKELSSSYHEKLRIFLSQLNKTDDTAVAELEKMLEKYQ